MDFPKQYSPKDFESRLSSQWKDEKSFEPKESRTGRTFYIPIPPPNVTGNLHIGHALTLSLQDIMIRYHRMRGDSTVWIPGTDHAGIATQAKVEEKLLKTGKKRVEMNREDFLGECWKWMAEYRGNIAGQTEKMGASVDWSRERFTFDARSNELVEKIFVDLYQKGILYRGEYMVNYSPALDSVISDIEVEHQEVEEKMYYINYFVSGSDLELLIATTRPETMLGDMALAVHPHDKRYKRIIGKNVLIPIINREIPVIADKMVDIGFGTGVVKITPAHDPADFETAKRHGIPVNYRVIDKKGYMMPEATLFVGQHAATEARANIVELLKSKGNLVKVEPYTHKVGYCSRGKCRIESVVSTQWFIRASEMAKKVITGYKKKEFEIIPSRFEKTFEDWIYNLRDWCISRQLWWGHQIPAYYHRETGELLGVTRDPSTIYAQHGEANVRRDDDVLDTWFSAATWPFSILDYTIEDPGEFFRRFYPANVLETGHDILFFWVIRMLMFGYEYTDQTPFRTIYLHGLIMDSTGRKMSKSWGNVINPLEVIDQYSADALRLSLILGNTPGNNLNFSLDRVNEQSLFLNKLWNIARFVSMNVGIVDRSDTELLTIITENKKSLLYYEKWILSRLTQIIARVTTGMEEYSFAVAGDELFTFIRDEFADFTIEAYKLEKDRSKYGKEVLSFVLITILKLAHPYIPFITEALYQQTTGGSRLITSEWPEMTWRADTRLEEDMKLLFEVVRTIRNLRAESKIKPSDQREVWITGDEMNPIIEKNITLIAGLTRSSQIILGSAPADPTTSAYMAIGGVEIFVDAAIDADRIAEERSRLMSEITDKKDYLRSISSKLMNTSFLSNAPDKVVRIEMEKQRTTEDQIAKLEAKLKSL